VPRRHTLVENVTNRRVGCGEMCSPFPSMPTAEYAG
jgi:hypothetical protein